MNVGGLDPEFDAPLPAVSGRISASDDGYVSIDEPRLLVDGPAMAKFEFDPLFHELRHALWLVTARGRVKLLVVCTKPDFQASLLGGNQGVD